MRQEQVPTGICVAIVWRCENEPHVMLPLNKKLPEYRHHLRRLQTSTAGVVARG